MKDFNFDVKSDKIKLISLIANVVLFIIIIGLIIGIAVTDGELVKAPANPVTQDQLVQVTTHYYPDKIEGPLSYQGQYDILNSKYFAMPDFANMESAGTLTIFPHFKTLQQSSEYTDMVSVVNMIRSVFGQEALNESYIGELVDCGSDVYQNKHNTYGSNPDDLEAGIKALGYQTDSNLNYASPENYPFNDYVTFENWVINSIKDKSPIIMLTADWSGHYLVPIGIDTMGTEATNDDVIIVADTYDSSDHRQDGYNIWGLERFFDQWYYVNVPFFGNQTNGLTRFIQVMNPNK